jgi:hypothetical protein
MEHYNLQLLFPITSIGDSWRWEGCPPYEFDT